MAEFKIMKRIAILASGSGSNAENIIKYFSANNEVEVPFVISNRKEVYVHERCKNLGVPSYVFPKSDFENGVATKFLLDNKIDLVVLAGFLAIIPQWICEKWEKRIINIHPSLLPKHGGKGMYGIRVQEAVLAAGDKEAGCTVHYVSAEVDGGGIIAQEAIAVAADDTPESLAERVQQAEKALLPQVVGNFVEG